MTTPTGLPSPTSLAHLLYLASPTNTDAVTPHQSLHSQRSLATYIRDPFIIPLLSQALSVDRPPSRQYAAVLLRTTLRANSSFLASPSPACLATPTTTPATTPAASVSHPSALLPSLLHRILHCIAEEQVSTVAAAIVHLALSLCDIYCPATFRFLHQCPSLATDPSPVVRISALSLLESICNSFPPAMFVFAREYAHVLLPATFADPHSTVRIHAVRLYATYAFVAPTDHTISALLHNMLRPAAAMIQTHHLTQPPTYPQVNTARASEDATEEGNNVALLDIVNTICDVFETFRGSNIPPTFLTLFCPFFVQILSDERRTVSTRAAAARFVRFAIDLVPEGLINCGFLDKVLVGAGNSIVHKQLDSCSDSDSGDDGDVNAEDGEEYDEEECDDEEYDDEWDIRLVALICHREETADKGLQYVFWLLDLLQRGDHGCGGREKALSVVAAVCKRCDTLPIGYAQALVEQLCTGVRRMQRSLVVSGRTRLRALNALRSVCQWAEDVFDGEDKKRAEAFELVAAVVIEEMQQATWSAASHVAFQLLEPLMQLGGGKARVVIERNY